MRTCNLTFLPIVFLLLCSVVQAQEPQTLVSGQNVEREIAGGQTHKYQISVTAGQFLRFRLEQRAVDAILILTAPDGKQLVEMNLTRAGQQESLSQEATATGSYRLTIHGGGTATLPGSYKLEATFQISTTAQDQKRLTAEALLVEANELAKQGGKTAQQVIDKQQQAVAIWRELNDPYWAAWSLSRIGNAYLALSQMEKAIEYYEQSLALAREAKDRISEATALNNLSAAYGRLSKFEKTIEYSAQALVIRREMKDRIGEVTALNNLGNGFNFLSRYEKAIEYYEQALAITIENKDRNGEMLATGNLSEWPKVF